MELRLENGADNSTHTNADRKLETPLGFNYDFITIVFVHKAKPDRIEDIEDFPCF